MKTPGQRGAFGDWLTRARTQRYATQADALHDFERLAGLRITPSQYAQWESGSRVPRADNPKVKALYDFFGSRPGNGQEEAAQPLGDQAAVVMALDRQTEALREQTAMMARILEALANPRSPRPRALRELGQAERELEARRGAEGADVEASESALPPPPRRLP